MKFSNSAFEKSLALLTHPASLAAILLLLLNDHWFRRQWPSWITGKLGDAAWLFFMPFVLAALIAWLVPPLKSGVRREAWVFGLAVTLTGAVFTLLKVAPAANDLAMRIFMEITGAKAAVLVDPGDLLALPALFMSAGLWWMNRGTVRRGQNAAPGRAQGFIVLPFALMVLLADAAAPDMGIQCFNRADGKIQAESGYNAYSSTDGGVTWQLSPGSRVNCQPQTALPSTWKQVPGPEDGTFYRYRANDEIQISTDGGKTWQTSLKLSPITEAEQLYFTKARPGNPIFVPGPQDALADPATGNMLFAMGHQGVLVRKPGGEWIWTQGGPYKNPSAFPNADAFWVLLGGMIYLAIELSFLVFGALALPWTRHWIRSAVLILAALGWLVVAVIFPPATTNSYTGTATVLGLLAVSILIVPLAVEQAIRLARRGSEEFPRLLALSLGSGLLFLLPYVLWLFGILPAFTWALLFSLLLAAAMLAAGKILEKQPARRAKEDL